MRGGKVAARPRMPSSFVWLYGTTLWAVQACAAAAFIHTVTGASVACQQSGVRVLLKSGTHPGVLATKVRYFGVKSTKVLPGADGHQTC